MRSVENVNINGSANSDDSFIAKANSNVSFGVDADAGADFDVS